MMTIRYVSGDSRNITVNVNGSDVKTLSCNSGGWGSVSSTSVRVTLEPGENVVRLYGKSSSSWMPNIDCMQLKQVGHSGRIVVGIAAPTAESAAQQGDDKYYTLDGRLAQPTAKG
jgi:hypothetical protein